MASTPLYKSLKSNGTTFYAFPGAAEDISAAYQNNNYKMYFSKYVLLNFPKQNTVSGTMSNPIYFDFDNSFIKSPVATPATDFGTQIIESLRNYVANQEVVVRESRLNNSEYYYNTNALETITEKVFWKWCKKIGLIDFEPAIPEDEYFSQLTEFQSNNQNDDEYFPEFLWKEREVTPYGIINCYQTNGTFAGQQYVEVEFQGQTNFRVGDLVNVSDITLTTVASAFSTYGYTPQNGINLNVMEILPAGATQGQRVVFNMFTTLSAIPSPGAIIGYSTLVYSKLVQYIGEVNGLSNVQEANRSYTEVYAHIPDHTGQTPDILFRTMTDVNYQPNLVFPIIPGQYQPEIMGAELFNSPIVSSPQNYPGSYFGQFDTLDYTYETATGDSLRRSGDYFGVAGDINNPTVDGSSVDGVTLDFNISHYVKMNIPRQFVTNFDQFNAQETNGEPPTDFEFNAILWYYTVEDQNGISRTNLYGISFLNNPNNNPVDEEIGLRFPVYKKLVTNGTQDGTSYAFSLNLNFNIINENVVDTYNPQAINSLFSMNLFNEAMKRLASVNDNFLTIVAEQDFVRTEIQNLKSLLYTQTDINVLNAKISNLEILLRLYSTNQIVSSSSIQVSQQPGTPPLISLTSIDTQYVSLNTYLTSNMYDAEGAIPINFSVPTNKNFLIRIHNNDEVNLVLPNNERLTFLFDRDLDLRQTAELIIDGSDFSSQNKKLDIYMRSDYAGPNMTEVLLLGNIDLPVFYNTQNQLQNSSYMWKNFNFDVDLNQNLILNIGNKLEVPFSGNNYVLNNSIKSGDVLVLNNFYVGTSSVFDFSGQYTVDSVAGVTSSYVVFDISSNSDLVSYGSSASLPLTIHSSTSSTLSNSPHFNLNKGKRIKITKTSNSPVLEERYYIQVEDLV